MNSNRKLTSSDPGFWPKWFGKLLFTLISVKVWGLVAGTFVSTWLLMIHLYNKPVIVGDSIIEYGINGTQWVTFNTTIWALIFGMKEIFRISEQNDFSEEVRLKENLDTKIKLAGMLSCDEPMFDEGASGQRYEKVGEDPDEK